MDREINFYMTERRFYLTAAIICLATAALITAYTAWPLLVEAKDWLIDSAVYAVEYEHSGGVSGHRDTEFLTALGVR